MSFLAGRLAAKEASYFLEESKKAVGRLIEKQNAGKIHLPSSSANTNPTSAVGSLESQHSADILPEVLRHSLPSKLFHRQQQLSGSSPLSSGSKWVIQSGEGNNSVSSDVLNPLRAYVSLPQVTFGPKRWQLPQAEGSFTASTANELRRDQYTPANPEKLKAAAEGLAHIGKAFAIATAVIFGGAALTFGLAASKLELHNIDDIRTKGRDFFHPKFKTVREQLSPLRNWAQDTSRRWHLEPEQDVKETPIVKELSKILGAKTSE